MYWLPKLHKRPYKARFIANSSSCTTTELSKLLTSCLTAIKAKVIKYCETVYERSVKNMFWAIKNSGEVDGDVPRRPSYGVYISELIRFARVCSHVDDFNTRKKCLTAKLLKQGYPYHKLRKAFSKFYRRHYEFISTFNVGLK